LLLARSLTALPKSLRFAAMRKRTKHSLPLATAPVLTLVKQPDTRARSSARDPLRRVPLLFGACRSRCRIS